MDGTHFFEKQRPPRQQIDFPGGASKFHILFDKVSEKYLALSNPYTQKPVNKWNLIRNVLVLMESVNLVNWNIVKYLVKDDNERTAYGSGEFTGFQQPTFLIDGEDLVYILRTA